MAVPELAADHAAVVVRGRFDPKLVTPQWLGQQGILAEPEALRAEVQMLIPGEVVAFETSWFSCHIEASTIQIATKDPAEFERARDIAVGILRNSPNVAAMALGINRTVHFRVANWTQWHAVGDALADNQAWDGVLELPGLRSLTTWGTRPDQYWGRIQVQVEASNMFPCAIFVTYNDHFDLTTIEEQPRTREEALALNRNDDLGVTPEKANVAARILAEEWHTAIRRSNAVIERVARQAEGER